MPVDRSGIERILCDMRLAIDSKKFFMENRKKNLDTLAILGYTKDDMLDEIYDLKYTEYFRGPVPDRDYPKDDDFWEFKRIIEGRVVYIKFKVRHVDGCYALFTSYHIDFM